MQPKTLFLVALPFAFACLGGDPPVDPEVRPDLAMPPSPMPDAIALRVLSSLPQHVSGGDARIAVLAPQSEHSKLELWLNGVKVTPTLSSQATRLEGVITGLALGENTLEVRHSERGKTDAVKLTNHPITGPMFAGPKQEPFVCSTVTELGKEPLVDTTDSKYFAVKDPAGTTVGYSQHCSIDSYVQYFYMPEGGTRAQDFLPLPSDGSRPANLAKTRLQDGREVDFVIRWERGTINRFIYQYLMLAPLGENPKQPDVSLWNQ